MEDREIADRLCGDTVRYIEEIKELQKRIDAETAQQNSKSHARSNLQAWLYFCFTSQKGHQGRAFSFLLLPGAIQGNTGHRKRIQLSAHPQSQQYHRYQRQPSCERDNTLVSFCSISSGACRHHWKAGQIAFWWWWQVRQT